MTSLLWSLESATLKRNFKKNYEKIEKILSLVNFFKIYEVLPLATKGQASQPLALKHGIFFTLLEVYGKHRVEVTVDKIKEI
jgi:hypothetical protein